MGALLASTISDVVSHAEAQPVVETKTIDDHKQSVSLLHSIKYHVRIPLGIIASVSVSVNDSSFFKPLILSSTLILSYTSRTQQLTLASSNATLGSHSPPTQHKPRS